MTAARDQRHERRLDLVGRKKRGRDVPVQVIHWRQRQFVRRGERLRGREADEQRGDEARAAGHGHEVDVRDRDARARERVIDHIADQLEVVSRGDLGDDAPEAVVDSLRRDHVGGDLAVGRHERGARVVAAGLDREYQPLAPKVEIVSVVRHMITASSPVSR